MDALPRDLLARPAAEASRRVALQRLDEAGEAALRLSDPSDAEALHDFRVALRRVRSTLRSFRPLFGDAVPKKLRRRLRRIADATGAARDSEVALAWLRDAAPRLRDGTRPAVKRLSTLLAARAEEGYGGARRAAEGFPVLGDRLRRALSNYTLDASGSDRSPSFGPAAAGLVLEHAGALADALGEIHTPADAAQIHRARIAAKRLRYLVEPLRPLVPAAAVLLDSLKAFQETSGRLHDAHVLGGILGHEAEIAAAARARRRLERELAPAGGEIAASQPAGVAAPTGRGLLALAMAVREEEERLFAALAARWLGRGGGAFVDAVEELARHLAAERA